MRSQAKSPAPTEKPVAASVDCEGEAQGVRAYLRADGVHHAAVYGSDPFDGFDYAQRKLRQLEMEFEQLCKEQINPLTWLFEAANNWEASLPEPRKRWRVFGIEFGPWEKMEMPPTPNFIKELKAAQERHSERISDWTRRFDHHTATMELRRQRRESRTRVLRLGAQFSLRPTHTNRISCKPHVPRDAGSARGIR